MIGYCGMYNSPTDQYNCSIRMIQTTSRPLDKSVTQNRHRKIVRMTDCSSNTSFESMHYNSFHHKTRSMCCSLGKSAFLIDTQFRKRR